MKLNWYYSSYTADVMSTSDYYPFGSPLPGRSFNSNSYDYGFNGMEKDDELKGDGNSYTTMFRQYDPRLGRWFSIDPLSATFPWQSPYVAFDNNPILINDPNGLAGNKINKKKSDNKEDRIKRKFKNKLADYKTKNTDKLVGLDDIGVYAEFKNDMGEKSWFKKYENMSLVSTSTGQEVEIQTPNNSRVIAKGVHLNSPDKPIDYEVDIETNKGELTINYSMFGIADRFQIKNVATGEVIFDTENVKGADANGKVLRKWGSGTVVKFDLGTTNGRKNTKIRIVVNKGDGSQNTVLIYKVRLKDNVIQVLKVKTK